MGAETLDGNKVHANINCILHTVNEHVKTKIKMTKLWRWKTDLWLPRERNSGGEGVGVTMKGYHEDLWGGWNTSVT